jgi:ATP-dependent Clp protease ATP-binding subunit ClpA
MPEVPLAIQLHAYGTAAVAHAVARSARVVSNEHLLLALVSEQSATATLLASERLDYDTLVSALDAERSRSLAIAGVTVDDRILLATPRTGVQPPWGASIRELMHTLGAIPHAKRTERPLSAHLAIAVISAQYGTVPRALAIGGLNSATLVDKLRAF